MSEVEDTQDYLETFRLLTEKFHMWGYETEFTLEMVLRETTLEDGSKVTEPTSKVDSIIFSVKLEDGERNKYLKSLEENKKIAAYKG